MPALRREEVHCDSAAGRSDTGTGALERQCLRLLPALVGPGGAGEVGASGRRNDAGTLRARDVACPLYVVMAYIGSRAGPPWTGPRAGGLCRRQPDKGPG